MITCKAKNCDSVINEDKKLTFHKFPLFDQKLLKSWLNNIAPPDYQPEPDDHVCSLHFTYDQFMKTQPWRLTRYAVPTILSRDAVPVNLHDIPDSNNESNKAPAGQNKRNTAKRKAAVLQEEETSDSSDGDGSDVSSSNLLSSSSDDDSECNIPTTRSKDKTEPEKTSRNSRRFSAQAPRYMGDFREEDLQSPEKMKKVWDVAYKEITEQRNKLYSITQRNKRLEGQVTRLKNVIRHLKSVHK